MARSLAIGRDSAGRLQARGERQDDLLLARLLETDLQEDAALAWVLLRRLQEACPWEFVGNAHRVSCAGETVTVASLFDAALPPCSLPRRELADLVADWLEHLGD